MQLRANLSSYNYLCDLRKSKAKAEARKVVVIPKFLDWCKQISPQYDFSYDWIKYVDEQQSQHKVSLFSIPPQHGKSTVFTIHKAAYRLIFYPLHRGIIISYNVDITARFHREILQLLEKSNVKLHSKAQSEIVLSNLVGSISFCGFQGGITSKPADWIIIDDPIRNAKDAYSETYQDILWSGFSTSIIPRLQEKFRLEITHTRWHEKDLIGQILDKLHNLGIDLDCNYINLPAICDNDTDPLGRKAGEVLCPQRFSIETIKTKMLLAEGDAYALYQGRPAPPDGSIFKKQDVEDNLFLSMSDVPNSYIKFISVDCAFKDGSKSDYVAMGVYSYNINSKVMYKLQQFRQRVDFEETVRVCEELFKSYQCQFGLIEDKANGSAVINVLNKKFPGKMLAINPEGGKIARAYAAQPFVKTKRLKFYRYMNNFDDFLKEMLSFPRGSNDDMVDETTQAINYIISKYPGNDYISFSRNISVLEGVRI